MPANSAISLGAKVREIPIAAKNTALSIMIGLVFISLYLIILFDDVLTTSLYHFEYRGKLGII